MYFEKNSNRLTARKQNERILIEAWGNNALRVRVTHNADFTEDDKALSPVLSSAQITIDKYPKRQNQLCHCKKRMVGILQ